MAAIFLLFLKEPIKLIEYQDGRTELLSKIENEEKLGEESPKDHTTNTGD